MYYYLLGSSRFRAKMADAMKVVVWYFAKSLSSLNPIDVHKNYQQPRDKRTRKVSVLKLADILHFLSLHSAGHKQYLLFSKWVERIIIFYIFWIISKIENKVNQCIHDQHVDEQVSCISVCIYKKSFAFGTCLNH